jgi:hypothetical protein
VIDEKLMKIKNRRNDSPATVTQLAAAMQALGRYTGDNSEAEHTAEAKRLGSAAYYRMLLANALLGIVETEAMLADGSGVTAEQMHAAHRQARMSAGAESDPAKLFGFLRWRTLWVEGPLREIAQNVEVGPVPLAAAHAAEGLQRLLEVCAAGQHPQTASPSALKTDLQLAREALTNAVVNIDIMLRLINAAEKLV